MKHPILLILLVLGNSSASVVAQTEQNGFFLTRLGRDTIAIEQYTSDAHGLRGTSVVRSPRLLIRDYSARFDEAGNLENFHLTARTEAGAKVLDRDFLYTNDSVQVTVTQDTSTTHYTVVAHDRPFPNFYDLFGGWQIVLQRVRDGKKHHFGLLAGKRVLEFTVNETSAGKMELVNDNDGFGPLSVEFGDGNRIEKFDMTATTDKFFAERIAPLNLEAVEKDLAERERTGRGLGILSPRDTVRADVGGAHLVIDYGRPAVRGRTIFGRVVPWDSVWRTGANAATQLMTDKELQFGSTIVPPGTYSLFSIPRADGWLLIINKVHGQWGTNYDQTKDLARVPLDIKHRDELVQRFTFEIAPGNAGGLLRFAWEHTEASIPFTVR